MNDHTTGTFGLVVRFELHAGCEAAFDALASETAQVVREREPGTLLYQCHRVEGVPSKRVFYELYRDRHAFEAHEQQPHVRHFLAAREDLLDGITVDFLRPI